MPVKGNKDTDSFAEIIKPGGRPKTANETKLGTLTRRDGTQKKWVKKILKSRNEVLVECATGEIYRYLIGVRQPKIRTGGQHEILSEFVAYRSIREILDEPEKRLNIANFRHQCCADLDGFMLVLFSSIFLEENDLSDQNYGLAILADSDGKTEEVEVEDAGSFVNITEAPYERYGQFIKIDHGQSLNSVRIARAWKPLSLAEIKYFHPPKKKDLDYEGMDTRTKGQRETIRTTRRKYIMEPHFLDIIIQDFLLGFFDRDYIVDLKFQPSALPLYDGRLIPFFDEIPEQTRYDRMERAKHHALAKIVFTDNNVMLGIATFAAHMDLPELLAKIIRKIMDNKEAIFKAIRADLDFCAFCNTENGAIQERIEESLDRMVHKRVKGALAPGESERYGELGGMNPVNRASLDKLKRVGEFFFPCKDSIESLILSIRKIAYTHNWKVGSGGHKVKIKGLLKTVPDGVYAMMLTLGRYKFSPQTRLYRTLEELIFLSCRSINKSSFWRSTETKEGYRAIAAEIAKVAATQVPVRYLYEKYNVKDAERYLDYYELSDDLFKYLMKNRK